mmetsp:Transcript_23140/g.53514  ORF Transcript_23140/g.53514 Transcript_23140/m.53514 type:complete len:148 (-) Transcript_23140:396-839(-)
MRGGGLKPEQVYAPQLANLEKSFIAAKIKGPALQQLKGVRESLQSEVRLDLDRHSADLRQALEDAIASRYLPESELLRGALSRDVQLKEAAALMRDRGRYDAILRPAAGYEERITAADKRDAMDVTVGVGIQTTAPIGKPPSSSTTQ